MNNQDQVEFTAIIQEEGKFTFIAIPFFPREKWGQRSRYKVTGTINSIPVQGTLGALKNDYFLRLSKIWLGVSGINPGDQVSVTLSVEKNKLE